MRGGKNTYLPLASAAAIGPDSQDGGYPRKYKYAARMKASTRPERSTSRRFQLSRVRRRSSGDAVP